MHSWGTRTWDEPVAAWRAPDARRACMRGFGNDGLPHDHVMMEGPMRAPEPMVATLMVWNPLAQSMEAGASLVGRERELVDGWLQADNFTCCKLQFGLEVRIAGRLWAEETDHFWHAASWFGAVQKLLKDGESSSVGAIVWNQSALGFQRDGAWVTMCDRNIADGLYGPYAPDEEWMPVVVSLENLVYELSVQGRILETLRQNLRADILRRGYTFEQLRHRLQGLGDRPVAPREDAELRLAIAARELECSYLSDAVVTLEQFHEGAPLGPRPRPPAFLGGENPECRRVRD